MLLARPYGHLGRRWCSSTAAVSDFLDWEELAPAISEDVEDEEPRRKSFYVPPPFTDQQLLSMSPERIAEWPKSRVVWALGRFGFAPQLRTMKDSEIPDLLLARASALLDTLNTRDVIRILQAVAYGPKMNGDEIIFTLRRNICTRIESVNDLFLVSLVFGHLKLIGRVDWTLTSNCKKTSQFLLSELFHRRNKMDATRFIEITSALISNERVLKSHNDSIQMILNHAISTSLKHVKVAKVLEDFGKELCCIPSVSQSYFTEINEVLNRKFDERMWKSGNDALDIGLYYFISELMTVQTMVNWMQAVRTALVPLDEHDERVKQKMNLIRVSLVTRNLESFLNSDLNDWVSTFDNAKVWTPSMVGMESLHTGSVIRRMVQSTVASGISPIFLSPFHLSAASQENRFWIEWHDQAELEPPHKKGVVKIVNELRRTYLESKGWKRITLDRELFKIDKTERESLVKMNEKFKAIVEQHALQSIVWREHVSVAALETPEKTIQVNEEVGKREAEKKRVGRESKSRAYRIKSKLKVISKEFRKKQKQSRHP